MHILNNVMEYYGEEWRVISALQEKVCKLKKKPFLKLCTYKLYNLIINFNFQPSLRPKTTVSHQLRAL